MRGEAIHDRHNSICDTISGELNGEISSVNREFSKIDMGGSDNIVEINSV